VKQQGFSDAEYVSKKKQTLRLRAGRARREAFLAEMVRAGAVVDAGGADRAALPEGRQFGYVKVRYRGLAKNTARRLP